MMCLFGSFPMCSNFYRFGLHHEVRVAITNRIFIIDLSCGHCESRDNPHNITYRAVFCFVGRFIYNRWVFTKLRRETQL